MFPSILFDPEHKILSRTMPFLVMRARRAEHVVLPNVNLIMAARALTYLLHTSTGAVPYLFLISFCSSSSSSTFFIVPCSR